jgi:hypothetical protein
MFYGALPLRYEGLSFVFNVFNVFELSVQSDELYMDLVPATGFDPVTFRL